MGFQNSAPRFDNFDLFVQALKLWAEPGTVADAAIISTEVPWTELLAGQKATEYVVNNYKGLAEYYRQHNLELWVYIDPANGLNRGTDANALIAAGKSIAQDDIQKVYRRFVVVMDSVLKPSHLGLALETNLIRTASPATIYNGVRKAASDAAVDVKARNSKAKLSISVQADVAWGSLQGTYRYGGIKQDLIDFTFMQEMGISSYPYFGYSNPDDVPDDYYSKLADEAGIPVFVSEGGWPSQSFSSPNNTPISSDAAEQADYVRKQAEMLIRADATALLSLTFTDIDPAAIPAGVDPTIQYFIYLGVVDKNLAPKPSFNQWKEVFSWRYTPN